LARLALYCVILHGFGHGLSAFGPKLDPTFGVNPFCGTNEAQQVPETHSQDDAEKGDRSTDAKNIHFCAK
jgi:hypothetical protein